MTQEDKELLLKDLCARLPYGLIIHLIEPNEDEELYCLNISQESLYTRNLEHNSVTTLCPIEDIKPYLRPISSMSEEEEAEYSWLSAQKDNIPTVNYLPTSDYMTVDWLNKRMFDYRGLIERGLALEAPNRMYNLEKK